MALGNVNERSRALRCCEHRATSVRVRQLSNDVLFDFVKRSMRVPKIIVQQQQQEVIVRNCARYQH